MKRFVFAFATVALSAVSGRVAAESPVMTPYERAGDVAPVNVVDGPVMVLLQERGIPPAHLCSDGVFIRRVYLDVLGALPEPREVRSFLNDTRPGKRAILIDSLLARDEFADYWALKWCDLLRVKAEFPVNLWPNAVQAYHRWIHDAIRENMPYDRFVRELLTSNGSNFRVPPVNFYRAIQGREPGALADAVALTFMGVRTDTWPPDKRADMAAFFSRLLYKNTLEWKEEIVCMDPAPAPPLQVRFPDGVAMEIAPGKDPRALFAAWLIAPDNPWFTRNIVNRVWNWLMGRGIIHEPDDIRPDNPPANPQLLASLEKQLTDARYDLRHLCRLILNSRTYQQSSIPQSDHPDAEALFAHYRVRRLDAEVLIDALCWLCGSGEGYSSLIPEPFSFIPEQQRTITLADGSITSPFLEMFGRPARDTGLESERNNQPTDAQRLHMLNSTHIQKKIERSTRLRRLVETNRENPAVLIKVIYLNVLSRFPTESELTRAADYIESSGLNLEQATTDLTWALINTKEFLYRH